MPPDIGSEVAFAGPFQRRQVQRPECPDQPAATGASQQDPGRTQLINFFEVEPERRLVDLPGYGYAKVPNSIRQHWQKLLEQYLRERAALRGLMMLMDIRHPLTPLDQQLLDWCAVRGLAVHILLTKADKLSRGQR